MISRLLILSLVFHITFQLSGQYHPVEDDHTGINTNNVDASVRPQDDFFLHVNGGWINETEIPSDQGSWGSFNELRESNKLKVKSVVQSMMNADSYDLSNLSDFDKVGIFYEVGMDMELMELYGFDQMIALFDEIDRIKNTEELIRYTAEQSMYGGNAFFSFSVFPDLMKSSGYSAYISQDGLGLPDKEYYFKNDEKSIELREKYVGLMEQMMGYIGGIEGDVMERSIEIMELEKQLAAASMNRTELRNIPKLYNPYSIKNLSKLTPSINWKNYFKELGVNALDTVIVMQPDFLKEMELILQNQDLGLLKDYLKWNVVNTNADFLTHDLAMMNFEFYGKLLSGATKPKERWKKVLAVTESVLGEAIGQRYVKTYFPPQAKVQADEMVDNILIAMNSRIKNLDWMSEPTKEKALSKLSSFTVKIGYPDKWKDYSTMTLKYREDDDVSYLNNVRIARKWQFEDMVSKLHTAVDKSEWGMTPQTVNAYYNPLNNEIVFPAAILQPPFFNFNADAPINYGGIGAVIGHEISHGFDDNGSRFDGEGNMLNWWTEEDLTNFRAKGEQLVAQYAAYEPLEGLFINGQLTLGENIGDLCGINLAWDALQMNFTKNGKTESLDGYTPEQRFFMSWGTIWRTKYREEALRSQVMTNPHAPGMYRANGPLMNMDAFYEAFDVKKRDGMYKPEEERISIW